MRVVGGVRQEGAGRQEGDPQVGRQGLLPALQGHLPHRHVGRRPDPGRGDADVEAPQGGDHLRHQAIGLLLAAQIGPRRPPRRARRPVPRRRPATCGSAPPPGSPSAAKARQMAEPMPPAPPVTRTALPARPVSTGGVYGPAPGSSAATPSLHLLRRARRNGGRVHIPDGFINLPTSRRVRGGRRRRRLVLHPAGGPRPRRPPGAPGRPGRRLRLRRADGQLPGGAGTSGHLLGGVLAAVLVGPWLGALVLTVVLVVQGVLLRRRRPHRPGAQRVQHGHRRDPRRLRPVPGPASPCCPRPGRPRWPRPGWPPACRCCSPPLPSSSSTPSAARAGPAWARWPSPWAACTPSSASARA